MGKIIRVAQEDRLPACRKRTVQKKNYGILVTKKKQKSSKKRYRTWTREKTNTNMRRRDKDTAGHQSRIPPKQYGGVNPTWEPSLANGRNPRREDPQKPRILRHLERGKLKRGKAWWRKAPKQSSENKGKNRKRNKTTISHELVAREENARKDTRKLTKIGGNRP